MLGMEYDLVLNYALNKFTAVELGYSVMKANNSLEYVKQAIRWTKLAKQVNGAI